MKRFLAKAGLAAALTLSVIATGALTGCGSQNASTQGTEEETTATVATSSGQAVSSSNSGHTGSDQASSVPTPTFDFSRDLDDNGHWKGITASDYVTLCDYSSIEIPASAIDVSDKVQKRMDSIVSSAGIDELTDDWVQQNYAESRGWKTVEDMRAALTESYQEDAKQTYIQNYVVEHSAFTEVPQTLLDYTKDYLVYQYTYMASQYKEKIANGTDLTAQQIANMNHIVVNNYTNAGLSILFLIVVYSIIFYGFKTWLAVRNSDKRTDKETPYVPIPEGGVKISSHH